MTTWIIIGIAIWILSVLLMLVIIKCGHKIRGHESGKYDNPVRLTENICCGEMVRHYLEQHGYDGLVEKYGECGCELDDLMPCGGDYAMECEAGYKQKGCTCGEGCNFHIVAGKKPVGS